MQSPLDPQPDEARPARAPVLFLVFNRPEATAKVFAAIRAARPPRLYVAADGPRPERPDDDRDCARVRHIALAVDWPCEVRTLLRDENLGCRRAVEEALDWFFAAEDRGIVLEDDCLPSASFFPFCEELLERYRPEEAIFSISGSNFQEGRRRGEASYYFSKYFHCWGWASWRRAWLAYRRQGMPSPPELASGLDRLADGSVLFSPYWKQIFRLCRSRAVDSWAYLVCLSCLARGGTTNERLHVIPQSDLVANIGFGPDATNTTDAAVRAAASEIELPLRHPDRIQRDAAADRHTDATHFGIAWVPFLRRQLALRFPRLERLVKRLRSAGS